MMKLWPLTGFLVVSLALCLVACGPGTISGEMPEEHDLLLVAREDLGQPVVVSPDQVAVIELPVNLTTGYGWKPAEGANPGLEVLGKEYLPPRSRLLGASGWERIYVAGLSAGEHVLELEYRRPYQAGVLERIEFDFFLEAAYRGDFQAPKEEESQPVPIVSGVGNLDLPAEFSWCDQGSCPAVRNQGSCGSCWAFATVAPLESEILKHQGQEVNLAEQYLVSCNSDNWSCNGGWWAHDYHEWKTVSGETEAGAVLENDFPYTATDQACNPPHAKAYRLVDWQHLPNAWSQPSVEDMKAAIYEHGPITVAVCVNYEFQAYNGGVFTGPSCNTINHGVALVGWNDAEGAWLMRNSWGLGWGENGYMRIGYGVSRIGYAAAYVQYQGGNTQANFSYNTNLLEVEFMDGSMAASGESITSWSWDFGDGTTSTDQNPLHSFAAGGTYDVTLSVTDSAGGSDSQTQQVTVSEQAEYCASNSVNCNEEWIAQVEIGSFSHSSDNQNYSDFTGVIAELDKGVHALTLTPEFVGGPWTEHFVIWIDFNDDGDFSDAGEEVFHDSGYSAVSGDLTIPQAAEEGDRRMRISMKYNSKPDSCEEFPWGEVEDYTVRIGSGGNDSPPTASYNHTVDGLSVDFTDTSSDPDGDIVSWAWDFGDGGTSTVQNPMRVYSSGGTYDVTLTVSDSLGLSDSITHAVTVNSKPLADFSFVADGLQVRLVDESSDADNDLVSRAWDLGDGTSASGEEVMHDYAAAGTYAVVLTVTDSAGNSDSAQKDITIQPLPQDYCPSQSLRCNYEWIASVDIGGFTHNSGAQNHSDFTATVVPLVAGNQPVTVTPGFMGTVFTEHVRIWIDFNDDTDFEDAGEEVFSGTGRTSIEGLLSVPGTAPAGSHRMRISMKYGSLPGPCETFTYGEVEDYSVDIGGNNGQPPSAQFSHAVTGRTVSFADQSSDPDDDIVSWSWNFGDGETSTEQNPSHTYAVGYSYLVTLTVTDAEANSDEVSQVVTLPSPPVAAFGYAVSGNTVTLTDQSSDPLDDIVSWAWDFGDGQTSSEQNPVHDYTAGGSYSISLTVTDTDGVADSVSQDVTVGIEYCEASSALSLIEWIANVEIDGFANPSDAQRYSDFTSQVIPLTAGDHSLTLTPGFMGQSFHEYFRVWIDFNNDGDFEDADEEVFSDDGYTAVSGTLTIPATAQTGQRRMRVAMRYLSVPEPCGEFTAGEVEDYTVSIIP